MRSRAIPRRQTALTDRGLLLRRTPFGNSSLVVHVLTESKGRVELIAKGAYRPKSRYAGVLDWFDTLQLDWTPPRRGAQSDLATLVTGDIATRRRWPTRDLMAYRAAQTIVELVDLATRSGAADTATFRLLEEGLDALDQPSPSDDWVLLRLAAFEIRLLGLLGLAPALETCASCGDPAPPVVDTKTRAPRVAFSAGAGGRLCTTHANEAHAQGVRVGTLPEQILAAAATLSSLPFESIGPGEVAKGRSEMDPTKVLDFTGRFLDHHLETRPRSHARFLAAPDRNRRQA